MSTPITTNKLFEWVTLEIAVYALTALFLAGSAWQVLASDIAKAQEETTRNGTATLQLKADVLKTQEVVQHMEVSVAKNSVQLRSVQETLKTIHLSQTRILNILERRYSHE